MMNTLIALTLILYSINMNIFMMLNKNFNQSAKHPFFKMLDHYKFDTYNFMRIYQSIMYKSTYVFIIIGFIILIRG